jgi:hypothetical protein
MSEIFTHQEMEVLKGCLDADPCKCLTSIQCLDLEYFTDLHTIEDKTIFNGLMTKLIGTPNE